VNLPFDPGVTGITFLNDTGEAVPPHGVMAVQGVGWNEGQQAFYLKVAKPTQNLIDDSSVWCFNGPTTVANNKTGKAYFALHQPAWVKIEGSVTFAMVNVVPPAMEVGPVAGQWYVSEDGSGMIVMGAREDQAAAGEIEKDRVLVLQRNAGGDIIVGISIVSVDDRDPDDITALCEVTTPCESVTDEDEYGRITVHDQMMGCLLNSEAPEDLVGRRGWCVRKAMRSDPYCEKKYQLGDLCCPEV
jgi:hypothetical protein